MEEGQKEKTMLRKVVKKQTDDSKVIKPFILKKHILTLHLTQRNSSRYQSFKHTPEQTEFKALYNTTNVSWRTSNGKYAPRSGRNTAITNRQCIVGTPFACNDLNQQELKHKILPLMSQHYYRYLINTISGIKRGRELSEIKRQKSKKNPEYIMGISQAGKRNEIIGKMQGKALSSPIARRNIQHMQSYGRESPRIVNISADLLSRKKNRLPAQAKDNYFQKIFKNKKKLHSRYYKEDQQIDFNLKPAQNQFQTSKMPWAQRNPRLKNEA